VIYRERRVVSDGQDVDTARDGGTNYLIDRAERMLGVIRVGV
jgi:hypothetical protein